MPLFAQKRSMSSRDLHERITTAFKPYQQEWEDWKLSDYCFLHYHDIVATEIFLRSGNIRDVAFFIRRTETTAKERILRSMIRLESSLAIFQEWKIIKNTARENDQLIAPIKCLPISIGLRNRLNAIGDTLDEVLTKYNRKELLNVRNMGKKRMQELEEFLTSIEALDWLRDPDQQPNFDSTN
jgi:Bacterial RNA polymerase, alpha chain C terminal domain